MKTSLGGCHGIVLSWENRKGGRGNADMEKGDSDRGVKKHREKGHPRSLLGKKGPIIRSENGSATRKREEGRKIKNAEMIKENPSTLSTDNRGTRPAKGGDEGRENNQKH